MTYDLEDVLIHGTIDLFNDVFYVILKDYSDLLTVASLQSFEWYDYNLLRFVVNKEGRVHVFETEEMAITKLKEWYYKFDEINPKFRTLPADILLVRE